MKKAITHECDFFVPEDVVLYNFVANSEAIMKSISSFLENVNGRRHIDEGRVGVHPAVRAADLMASREDRFVPNIEGRSAEWVMQIFYESFKRNGLSEELFNK